MRLYDRLFATEFPDRGEGSFLDHLNPDSLKVIPNAKLERNLASVGIGETVQFERLVGELTWWHPTRWIHVPRAGAESRFIPVKDLAELERSGAAIRAVIDARLRDP